MGTGYEQREHGVRNGAGRWMSRQLQNDPEKPGTRQGAHGPEHSAMSPHAHRARARGPQDPRTRPPTWPNQSVRMLGGGSGSDTPCPWPWP